MTIPTEVLELIGALALAVPITASRVPKWIDAWNKARTDAIKARSEADAKSIVAEAEAKKATAEADRLEAETAKHLLELIGECERKHDEQFERAEKQDEIIAHMQRQIDSDQVIIVQFQAKIEADEKRQLADERLMAAMQKELVELRRVIETGIRPAGGRHA